MSWHVFEPQGCEYESHLQDTLDGKWKVLRLQNGLHSRRWPVSQSTQTPQDLCSFQSLHTSPFNLLRAPTLHLTMEPFMQSDDNDGRVRVQLPADLPFDQKWDVLKPVIKQLYLDQDRKLHDVMEMVKAEHGFVAT